MNPRKMAGYGWRPQLPDHRDYKLVLPAAVLPAEVDLEGLSPPVYDQGQAGSCTANMGAYLWQFCAYKEAFSDRAVPSRLFLYWNERVLEDSTDYDSGAQCRDALKVLATIGTIPETEWPYDLSKLTVEPTAQCFADAKAERSLQYRAVDPNRAAIKAALASGFPVGFGFTVYESFEGQTVALTGLMPMPTAGEKIVGGHAVARVGYIDNALLPRPLPNKAVLAPHPSGGYYKVRNSWGADWGINGYFYAPYDLDKFSSDFWVLQAI